MEKQYHQEDTLAPMLRPGSEGMTPFYRFLIVIAVYMAAIIATCVLCWLAFCYFFNHQLFVSLWDGLVQLWNWLKIFGFILAGLAVLYTAGRIVTSILARLPRAQAVTFDETQNAVIYGTFRARQFAYQRPPVAERRRVKKLVGSKVELAPPSLAMQIATGLLSVGMPDTIHGFELASMTPVRLRSYSSLTIGGTGSGKTRGNAWRNLQRAIVDERGALALVTVCDPHATKGDGIAPLVEGVEGYIRIARTPQEIVSAARDFYTELEARKAGRSAERTGPKSFKPRHIFFDEWAALMDTKAPDYPYSAEDRALFLAVMLGCVREYRGYGGYGHISMQNPKQSNIGDVTLRDDMPLLLVHKVSENTCSFIYPSAIEAEKRKQVLKLKMRQCFIDCRTEEYQATAVLPDIEDDMALDFLALMQDAELAPLPALVSRPPARQLRQASAPGAGQDEMLTLKARADALEQLISMLQGEKLTVPDMPDTPVTPRRTRPLTEQRAEHIYEGGYSAEPIRQDEQRASSARRNTDELDTPGAGQHQAIGREVVLEQLDAMISGKMTAHDFLKWAKANGGRKYTSRRQAIQQLQELGTDIEDEEE
ncbi:hypothetical protein [Ktedonobacter racemifer]|uniref:Uncharacterized protein n=1 Tax=Ktedonobacter racemifer DSM 44963 TaxID=485913 RepID=D6U8Z3_KTERA|nr:hypothetical protein [Ktedonobacter racemifer]EFH79548.1 hypothetical protein Krac_0058 [Ktedonobacter racemifer DSM 44963]